MAIYSYKSDKIEAIKTQVSFILDSIGEDSSRAGLKDTPKRAAKALMDLTSGHGQTPADIIKDAIFPCESQGMILQKDIEFYSLCEHHMLPFFGKVHIAYMPDQKIIGLSKMGRLVDIYAKRLQVQEQLNLQIINAIDDILKPKGVAVFIEANHLCMMMRGVQKQKSVTVSREYSGLFLSDNSLRDEFLHLIK